MMRLLRVLEWGSVTTTGRARSNSTAGAEFPDAEHLGLSLREYERLRRCWERSRNRLERKLRKVRERTARRLTRFKPPSRIVPSEANATASPLTARSESDGMNCGVIAIASMLAVNPPPVSRRQLRTKWARLSAH